jgi:hypothetical protein
MTEEHELKIPYQDLVRVSIECRKCKAEIVIDLRHEFYLNTDWSNKADFICPVCEEKFHKSLRLALNKFKELFAHLDASEHSVFFRIKQQ